MRHCDECLKRIREQEYIYSSKEHICALIEAYKEMEKYKQESK